ncbi:MULTISPECIES: DUF4913 domain-containing protein [Streptomyces]|uniref:DUF4913 domain-containing protein n=1 Tax=Streptomyces tsukubensis (strain DSM 42081 / NBRC 108919 / NRRL 18488 / 9993) TaxID=1114943 RepID=I2N7V7_STRT9|nr:MULTISPECIES: DUF4913 domain-containing protein [Streptomyces]AZK98666.1 DUF4913 domain-containing protein [Streptomyces tsukubensis]EIF93104.1 hypothetical protein [Streptomyces tsukubensis NRRL18488]MYS66500.1 DUF4913 domain-containing protein [Streptomyces sp. SID5473]QKM71434.1 DUF4913 domain-containing protein [Streptomyces tsukubensis NRRL18488]TAI41606.1 DUF4913 domain-containing protein [Streptomyces tsukubensis]
MEPIRFPESGRESIEADVRRLMDRTAEQAQQLDSLSAGPGADSALGPGPGLGPRSSPFAGFGLAGYPGMPGMPPPPPPPPEPKPILELDGEQLEDEVDALTDWVDGFLLPAYGAEVTTAAPWCDRWQEHRDVIGWLHALWMAYQQHKEPDAGLSGMLVWHRDFLTHTMAAVRAPGGPLSACMTDPDRPAHRLLPGPKPSTRTPRPAPADQSGEASS